MTAPAVTPLAALPALLAAPLAAHGHGVEDAALWMWAVWAAAFAITAWTIWAAVKVTFRPGETEPDHVKRSILDDDGNGTRGGAFPAGPLQAISPTLGGPRP